MISSIPENANERVCFYYWRHFPSMFAVAALIVVVTQVANVLPNFAQTAESEFITSVISGQVTGLREDILQINNKDYQLKPEVIIKDDEDKPMGLNEIVPGAEVKCRQKHGRIDLIVVILPK